MMLTLCRSKEMRKRNTIRILIASFLLMLATGSLLVKSVHCVFISHDLVEVTHSTHTSVSQNQSDSCPICSFDFFPVIVHSLQILPDVNAFSYLERIYALVTTPVSFVTHLFLLRAPPVA